MPARKKRPLEYEGTTISGRPILDVEAVQRWFSDEGCKIPADAAAAIARDINRCTLESFMWKNTPELRAARRKNPSLLAMQRIHNALKTLQKDLPLLIDNTLRVRGNDPPPSLAVIEDLLRTVNQCEAAFRKYERRGRGREPDLWRNVARNIGGKIAKALAEHTGRRAGLGKPTSPAIRILKSALAYLDEDHSEDAIVDAVRPKRMRRNRKGLKR